MMGESMLDDVSEILFHLLFKTDDTRALGDLQGWGVENLTFAVLDNVCQRNRPGLVRGLETE